MSNSEYISPADTAKLIRKQLKAHFPKQKFSVRTSTYSLGASIDVRWTDGPTEKEVKAFIGCFAGAGFDGSIDLKYDYVAWLLPDGSVETAYTPGTSGSRGAVPPIDNRGQKPHPDAKLVSFGADYVFTSRDYSPELTAEVGRRVHEETGWDIPEIYEPDGGFKVDFLQTVPGSHEPLADRFNRELWATSAYEKPQAEEWPESETRADIQVEREGDWLWVYFPDKPDEGIRASLKELGGRFSGKRKAWYFTPRNCVPYTITEVEGLVRCLLFNEPRPEVRIQKLTEEDLFDPIRVARRNQRQAVELGQFN